MGASQWLELTISTAIGIWDLLSLGGGGGGWHTFWPDLPKSQIHVPNPCQPWKPHSVGGGGGTRASSFLPKSLPIFYPNFTPPPPISHAYVDSIMINMIIPPATMPGGLALWSIDLAIESIFPTVETEKEKEKIKNSHQWVFWGEHLILGWWHIKDLHEKITPFTSNFWEMNLYSKGCSQNVKKKN